METQCVRGPLERVGVGALLVLALAEAAAGQVTRRVSVDSSGVQGNGFSGSFDISISADGRYVAFPSLATNLVPGDTTGEWDIFVRDRHSGTTERVSVDSSGVPGNSSIGDSAISADGRYVAFDSLSLNLVPGDTNGQVDIFVRDRQSGTTERVSVDSSGAQATGGGAHPSISADGRYVAFSNNAANLVGGDTNGWRDVFVRDRQAATTERVSLDSSGAQGNNVSTRPSISADGRWVAFGSSATNLVLGDTNAVHDAFVRDRQLGTTERVSLDSSGAQGDDRSGFTGISISANGRYVAFESLATNLVPGDTNGVRDVFVRDRQSGTTERVSLDSSGAQGNGESSNPRISADGRSVAFDSAATNLVPGDTNGTHDVFIRDRQSGTTERANLDSSGAQGNGSSGLDCISISADGRYVAFDSLATNLVPGDTNGFNDIFVRDRAATGFTSLCHPGVDGVIGCPCGQPPNPVGGCANFGAGATSGAVLSASGVAYVSADTLLLTTSNHRSPAIGVLNVFFSYKLGTVTTGTESGAGVRCYGAGGSLKRLYTMQVFGGTGSKPGMGDLSVSARSATFTGHAIVPGETRYYFNVYRDGQASGPCGNAATSTNLTNTGSIAWNL
ncbi:MAG: TolB family protein [Planctomycetota bacterium]